MKVIPLLTVVITAILFSGCARNSLTLENGSKQLAPVFGSENEELVFINHVLFTKLGSEQQEDGEEVLGYVAVTDSELVLGEGSPRSGEAGVVLKVAISELDGFAAPFGPFIQLAHQGERYIVFPYRWFIDTSDFQSVNELATLLHEQEVPTLEPWKVSVFDHSSFVVAGTDGITLGDGYERTRGGLARSDDLYTDEGFYDLNGNPKDSVLELPNEPLYPVQLDNSLNGTPPPYPEGRYPTTGQ